MSDDIFRRAGGDHELAAKWAAEKAEDRRQYAIARNVDRGTGIHTHDTVLRQKQLKGVYGELGLDLCGECWRGVPNRKRPRCTMQGNGGRWRVEIRGEVFEYPSNPGPYWNEWYDRSVWPMGVSTVFHRVSVHPVVAAAMYSIEAHAEAYGFDLPGGVS